MDTLKQLKLNNPNRTIYGIDHESFSVFGRVLELTMDPEIRDYMLCEADFPQERNIYVASEPVMEESPMKDWVEHNIYSGMESQFGYCNGLVSQINGFEFHQCSEVFIAVTDCILALIKPHTPVGSDEPYQIDESYLYYVPEGTVMELYPMTGHFSPIRVHESGYRTVIILLRGTNEALDQKYRSNELSKDHGFAKNKWLFVHEDRMDLVEKGAHLHVLGDNSPIQVI